MGGGKLNKKKKTEGKRTGSEEKKNGRTGRIKQKEKQWEEEEGKEEGKEVEKEGSEK